MRHCSPSEHEIFLLQHRNLSTPSVHAQIMTRAAHREVVVCGSLHANTSGATILLARGVPFPGNHLTPRAAFYEEWRYPSRRKQLSAAGSYLRLIDFCTSKL